MQKLTFSALALVLAAGCSDAANTEAKAQASGEVKAKASVEQKVEANVDAVVEKSDGISLWEELLTAGHRSDKNKQRDQYRHPQETLEFFGIKPGMTVVEIAPGGGWYTEILSPLLGPQGKLYAAHFDPDSEVEYYRNGRAKFERKMDVESDVYGNVEITTFQPPEMFDIAPEGSADAVVTFRNVHNWLRGGREATVDSFKAMYKALKPGGVLGVVEHRLPASQEQDEKASSGYMHQQFVIDVAQDAGFKLVASSEINANPKDTANHPKGVWTLPPSLRLGEEDQDKYLEIGESDRMTLKFVKPAKK
ncbi:class I SAM-dependent methyltransferase [Kangiella geojedonensis]|uniref:O-methyltransferase n=1 Tax=Kangiella geojedonensis TaxID=914150 RepID=A0A0F6RC98_9GAMM|nr:class I SAM-dependent methyltransferase [Kangiella geojedonensis]AKE52253.1 O-methyltransferase [Kangiella geojedonensis]